MNRGLYLQVSPPDAEELNFFANQILQPLGEEALKHVPSLTKGYLATCQTFKHKSRPKTEFFGLRDFYSLIKMIAHLAKSAKDITRNSLEYCIRRNFGGFPPDDKQPDHVSIFVKHFERDLLESTESADYPVNQASLLKSSLFGLHTSGLQTRYLMILSENISVLNVILEMFEDNAKDDKEAMIPDVIFGSAFRDDLSYTQVCKNVYKIRMCMAKGQTAIILNIDDLHESLYDLLNQSFYKWGKKSFVDIGIGIHRVPAHVDEKFRLILIAEKDEVYAKFPIPLINRFEKHYVSAATVLDQNSKQIKKALDKWMREFDEPLRDAYRQYFDTSAVTTSFVGHSSDMSALAVLKATNALYKNVNYKNLTKEVFNYSKKLLLQNATAESVLRLPKSKLKEEEPYLREVYVTEQKHDDLLSHLQKELGNVSGQSLLIQVTTFAELMSEVDVHTLEEKLSNPLKQLEVKNLYLTTFTQEAFFKNEMSAFCQESSSTSERLLIVQCESANSHSELLNSVRYILQREHANNPTHMVLLLSLSRGQKFTAYQGEEWSCVHIDDLRFHHYTLPCLSECMEKEPHELIECDLEQDSLPVLASSDHESEEELDESAITLLKPRVFPSLMEFIKHCLPQVFSKIRCHKDKDYNRLGTVTDLLMQKTKFTNLFLKHVKVLLQSQHSSKNDLHWTMEQAADARKMKMAETMRIALSDTLEEKYRPALAAVIAFIDPQRNLRVLQNGDQNTVDMWLSIFEIGDKIGLAFEQGLPHWFKMYHVGDENEMSFEAQFPFCWKVKEAMDEVMVKFLTSGSDQQDTKLLTQLFYEGNFIGKLVTDVSSSKNAKLLEAYIHDFIYLSHPYQPVEHEHTIIKDVLQKHLSAHFADEYGIPHVHLAYEHHRTQLKNLADVVQLRSSVASAVEGQMSAAQQDIDMIALKIFVSNLTETDHDNLLKAPEEWISQVDQCKALTDRMLSDKEKQEQENEKNEMKWPKLEFKQLYVKHVVAPTKPDPVRGHKSQLIQTVLMGVARCDFHRKDEFYNVVEVLKKVQKHFFNRIKGNDAREIEFKEITATVNKFFMEFVCSNLVFSPKSCPDLQVLEWLSSYATFQKQPVFNLLTCEDSSQQQGEQILVNNSLLKCYFACLEFDDMTEHLNNIISDLAGQSSTSEKHLRALKAVISCYQDFIKEDVANKWPQALLDVVDKYQETVQKLKVPSVESVHEVASLQTLISHSVNLAFKNIHCEKQVFEPAVKLLKIAHAVDDLQIGYFICRKLLKDLGDCYVMDFIKSRHCTLIPQSAQQDFEGLSVPDVFEAFGGDIYENIKNQLEFDVEELMQNETDSEQKLDVTRENASHLIQAIFTKVTRATTILESVKREMHQQLKYSPEVPEHPRRMIKVLFTKKVWSDEMDVTTYKGVNLSMLVVHAFTSFGLRLDNYVTSPFTEIIADPTKAVNKLLPGMPAAPLDILLDQCGVHCKDPHDMDHLCVYVCQSGHPYVVEEAASPDQVQQCPFFHAACSENMENTMICRYSLGSNQIKEKRSKCGNAIGWPKASENIKGVRELKPLSCAVIRVMTHLSVLVSYLLYPKEAVKFFQPKITDKDIVPLLNKQIWKYLQLTAELSGESIDNCILLIHQVLHDMSQAGRCNLWPPKDMVENRVWERELEEGYIQQTFGAMGETVAKMKESMKTWTRCSEILNNLLTTSGQVDGATLLMSPSLWEYRGTPNLDHMLQKLDPTRKDFKILSTLVEHCDTLVALKHLPNVLKLTISISDGFHGQLSREEAKEKARVLMQKHANILQLSTEQAKTLVDSYISAWNTCSSSGFFGLAETTEISEDPPISEFLLDKHNMLTSRPLNLIRCLIEAHNRVVAHVPYSANIPGGPSSRKSLKLSEVTASQLVQVSSKEEILHLLSSHELANPWLRSAECLIDHVTAFDFIGQKRPISLNIEELPFYKFKEDFELWKQIELLKHKQVKISERLQQAIMASVNLTSKSLNKDIKEIENILNHLSTMPLHDPNMKLCDMTATLCVGTPRYLREDVTDVIDGVKVKHVLHIWLMLKYAQADVFMEYHPLQNPFDEVHDSYMSNTPANVDEMVNKYFQPKHCRTKEFLVHLFEYITLRLHKVIADYDANKEVSSQPLHKALKAFVRRQNPGNPQMIESAPELPKDILVRHAGNLWPLVWKIFNS